MIKFSNLIPTAKEDNENIEWWKEIGVKVVGSLAGAVGIMVGMLNLITVNSICFLTACLLILEGLLLMLIEVPCFCLCIDFAYVPSAFIEKRPHWFKAVVYFCFALMPLILCIGFTTFIASGFMFIAAALYTLIQLGRKATLPEMKVNACEQGDSISVVLVKNEHPIDGNEIITN